MTRTPVETTPQPPSDGRRPARRKKSVWQRVLLVAAMILATLNIWTGSPLIALWVGSQLQAGSSSSALQMTTVGAVVLVLAAMVFLLVRAIAWLDVRYAEAVGRPPKKRQVRPWMRSLAGKYGAPKQEPEPLTPLERILVVMVVIVVVLFEVWFFFFAGSPLPE
jgi:thiosulfate reductase cytochrome b subunit